METEGSVPVIRTYAEIAGSVVSDPQAARAVLNRREALKLGAASTAGAALAGLSAAVPASGGEPSPRSSSVLRTPLCDLLGIRYPLLQAPMARVVTPEMVAEVGRAGGLGIVAGTGIPPEDLRKLIRRVKDLSDRPYGVNLILHPSVRDPVQPEQIPAGTMSAIQGVLNRFRERLGIPEGATRAPVVPAITDEAFDVILEEHVPVFSVGLGKPTPAMMARCRAQGAKVVAMAATVPDALELAALRVDAIIAQGGEAGGHRSTWVKRASPEMAAIGTMALLPQIADAVQLPVVGAGGFMNGRQLVAALVLGASGILMGTRFIATRESAAPDFYKKALVDRDSDDTTIADAFTGLYARVLRSTYTEEYRASGAPVVPVVQQAILGDITAAAAQQGNAEFYPMYAGQGLGMIQDVPSAATVVQAVVSEAEQALEKLVQHWSN
jgi:nitronate monooxygenase